MTDAGDAFSAHAFRRNHRKVDHKVGGVPGDGANDNQAASFWARRKRIGRCQRRYS